MNTPETQAQTKRSFLIRAKNIPTRLKELPHWLVWKYGRKSSDKPGAKLRKFPYYTNGQMRSGTLGSAEDVSNLAEFTDALKYAKENGFDGVGLAVLREQDLTILDLDDCIDDDGVYSEFATRVLEESTYVERSPSGRGLRAVFEGAITPGQKKNFHLDTGERVEVYCGSAYTTFTGNIEAGCPEDTVADLPKSIASYLKKCMRDANVSTDSGGDSITGSNGDLGGDVVMSMNAAPIRNMTPAQALRVLQGLPEKWGASGEGTWYQVAAALHMQFDGSDEAYEVLDKWSSERDGYDPDSNAARWRAGFSHNAGKQNVLSMRNLVFEARDAGVKFKQSTLESWGLKRAAEEKAAESDIELPEDDLDTETAAAWVPKDLSTWGTPERPPGTPALVKGWLYEGSVALFSSHGGSGKSYVSLTFAALAAAGGKWFGEEMVRGRALFVNGEDPINEVHHRLWGICSASGIGFADLADQLDIVDVTPVLHKALYTAGTDFGKTEFTKQFNKMKELVRERGHKYIVLDNLSKFYMANENARPMVDEFISALAAMGAELGAGVVLVGHTAKLGGEGYSGSTAWHNSARARWSLVSENGERKLMVEKNNYGKTGHGGKWVWDDTHGAMVMGDIVGEGQAGSARSEFLISEVAAVVTDLYSQREWTHHNTKGPVGAIEQNPRIIDIGLNQKELRGALLRAVDLEMLAIEEYKDEARRKKSRYCPVGYEDI